MDALDRILPLASLLWPLADCDASIRRDPAGAETIDGVPYLARVFDTDGHPDADPLADASGPTPTAAAEALARHLATLARPRIDVLMRAAGVAPSQRADLAADVARLERRLADLTRERDGAHQLALATATERDRLRAQLDAQPAHRAAGDGVDLARYVLRADVRALCEREARAYRDASRYSDAFSVTLIGWMVADGLELPPAERDLRGEHVEGGEQQGVEGGEGHEATIGRPAAEGKAHVG